MKKIVLIIMLLVCVYIVKAQSEVEVQNIVLPAPVIDSLEIDSYSNICGIWREMKLNCLDNEFAQRDNKIWRKQIKIQSEGAEEIKIVFQKFILSPNAVISFYTDSLRYQYHGTLFVQKQDSSYISNFLRGDYCTITIEIPIDEFDKNQIIISRVYHFTKSFYETAKEADYSCMIDVNCSEGNDWCDQKRSVALYYFPTEDNLIGFCTGTLVNNYKNDFTQYFLTARHCTNEVMDWATTQFYFNYQNSFCNGMDGWFHYGVQGAELVEYCDYTWSDNALLLITEPIPIQENVYYAGVDITDRNMGDKVTCIHHSKVRPKKIVSGKLQHFAGPKWEIYWDNGVITNGGSGAPVFLNSNKRVIATISSGFSHLDCSNNYRQEWVGKVKACNAIKDVLFGNSELTSYSGIDPIKACQSTLTLQGYFYSPQGYDATLNDLTIQASNTITVSNATLYTGSYTFMAGNEIVLLPSTKIGIGIEIEVNVTIEIAPCSESIVFCGTHSSDYKSTDNYSQEYRDYEYGTENTLYSDIVAIYPNPNNGTFTINTNFDPQEVTSIRVLNTVGQTVYQQAGLPNNTIQLPFATIGMFWVEITTSTQKFIKKMVVQTSGK